MNKNLSRIDEIRNRLQTAFDTEQIEIIDDSASHAGHEGAKSGGGHFDVIIVSDRFADLGKVARHRLVYAALSDMMKSEIHALSINAMTTDELP